MRRVHADRAARPGVRSIAMAHAFVSPTAGALVESDSERDISVGGVSMVSTDVFDGMDYVALRHLPGRHTTTDSIRYSASPLAYAFSEADHRQGSWLVAPAAQGFRTAEFVYAPAPRRQARLTGTT